MIFIEHLRSPLALPSPWRVRRNSVHGSTSSPRTENGHKKSTFRLSGLKPGVCSGLILSGALNGRFKNRGLAPSNVSITYPFVLSLSKGDGELRHSFPGERVRVRVDSGSSPE